MFSRSVSGSSIRNEWASRRLVDRMKRTLRANTRPVNPWPRSYRGGKPAMRDTGELERSIKPFYDQNVAIAGTEHVRGTHDSESPRTITTGKNRGYLSIPLSPPLSASEARMYNNNKVPGGFVLYSGPEGPGVYIRSSERRKASYSTVPARGLRGLSGATRRIKTSRASTYKTITRVKAFIRKTTIPARSFAKPQNDWIQTIRDGWLEHIVTGKLPK